MRWEQDLIKDIRTGTAFDNDDGNQRGMIVREFPYSEYGETSPCNKSALLDRFLRVRDNARAVMEIGVCRNGRDSFTHTFLNNKKQETIYVGIDIEDKSFLNNTEQNIFTIRASSSNVEENIEKIKSFGVEQFDFIFIDGWHSINQCLIDWEYTQLLSPIGIVAFHDVSEHPGPYTFIKHLNKDIWQVEENVCLDDWGIGFAWKK
jgi:predicted O-methyltransferase YrrM